MNQTPRMLDAVSFPEVKIFRVRECYVADISQLTCDTPERVAKYWNDHVPVAPWYIEDREHFVVFHVNTKRRIIGMNLVSISTLDTILAHPREVFRAAIVNSAAGIILAHNHPSGDPTPSEADIHVTREMIQGGQLLRIEVLDHVVIGKAATNGDWKANAKGHMSLRELGYFYS